MAPTSEVRLFYKLCANDLPEIDWSTIPDEDTNRIIRLLRWSASQSLFQRKPFLSLYLLLQSGNESRRKIHAHQKFQFRSREIAYPVSIPFPN